MGKLHLLIMILIIWDENCNLHRVMSLIIEMETIIIDNHN